MLQVNFLYNLNIKNQGVEQKRNVIIKTLGDITKEVNKQSCSSRHLNS